MCSTDCPCKPVSAALQWENLSAKDLQFYNRDYGTFDFTGTLTDYLSCLLIVADQGAGVAIDAASTV